MHITLFEDLIALLQRQLPMTCGMMGKCQPNLIIEANGTVYPCDFYALDEYKIGHIVDDDFQDMAKNKIFMDFSQLANPKMEICDKCEFYSICHGNCKRMRSVYIQEEYCGYKDLLQNLLSKMHQLIN